MRHYWWPLWLPPVAFVAFRDCFVARGPTLADLYPVAPYILVWWVVLAGITSLADRFPRVAWLTWLVGSPGGVVLAMVRPGEVLLARPAGSLVRLGDREGAWRAPWVEAGLTPPPLPDLWSTRALADLAAQGVQETLQVVPPPTWWATWGTTVAVAAGVTVAGLAVLAWWFRPDGGGGPDFAGQVTDLARRDLARQADFVDLDERVTPLEGLFSRVENLELAFGQQTEDAVGDALRLGAVEAALDVGLARTAAGVTDLTVAGAATATTVASLEDRLGALDGVVRTLIWGVRRVDNHLLALGTLVGRVGSVEDGCLALARILDETWASTHRNRFSLRGVTQEADRVHEILCGREATPAVPAGPTTPAGPARPAEPGLIRRLARLERRR